MKLRIMAVLFSDEIPDPRDIVIICLADSCGIFQPVAVRQELSRASERIEQVRKLDLIGQAMAQAIPATSRYPSSPPSSPTCIR